MTDREKFGKLFLEQGYETMQASLTRQIQVVPSYQIEAEEQKRAMILNLNTEPYRFSSEETSRHWSTFFFRT